MEENKEIKKIIYTNSIGVEVSTFDMKLNLDYVTTDNDTEQKIELCEVVMSPQHAKAFLETLTNAINMYEEKIGKIDLKPIKEKEK